MHGYRSISVLAIDSGQIPPHIVMSLTTGPHLETACHARKMFGMDDLGEVRDILGWASLAFLTAADELTADGWTITHHETCEDRKELDLDA